MTISTGLTVQCVHCGKSIQHTVPSADSGGSPVDYIWGCAEY